MVSFHFVNAITMVSVKIQLSNMAQICTGALEVSVVIACGDGG